MIFIFWFLVGVLLSVAAFYFFSFTGPGREMSARAVEWIDKTFRDK